MSWIAGSTAAEAPFPSPPRPGHSAGRQRLRRARCSECFLRHWSPVTVQPPTPEVPPGPPASASWCVDCGGQHWEWIEPAEWWDETA